MAMKRKKKKLILIYYFHISNKTLASNNFSIAAPSSVTESASHEDTHTRQESLIITGNADSTCHHSVEQEHINFSRDGQQFLFNEPSSEPYAAQVCERSPLSSLYSVNFA